MELTLPSHHLYVTPFTCDCSIPIDWCLPAATPPLAWRNGAIGWFSAYRSVGISGKPCRNTSGGVGRKNQSSRPTFNLFIINHYLFIHWLMHLPTRLDSWLRPRSHFHGGAARHAIVSLLRSQESRGCSETQIIHARQRAKLEGLLSRL